MTPRTKEQFEKIRENKLHFWKLLFSILLQPQVMELIHDRLYAWFPPLLETMKDFFRRKGADDPETEALFFHVVIDGIYFYFYYVNNPEMFPLKKIKSNLHYSQNGIMCSNNVG